VNYRMVFYTVGRMLKVEAALLVLPLITAFIYGDSTIFSFLLTIAIIVAFSMTLTYKKPENKNLFSKEGLVIVALAWLLMSVFGALPFYISGSIPSFVDALFETVSGFTTTGATVLSSPESMAKSILFWRSFTHWIGGMGVLVFVLAIFPQSDTHSMYLMRAEVPGPKVGKLVSKIKLTARILYLIYICLTIIETIFLLCGGMSFYDALLHSFSTAGTGGFSTRDAGIAAFDSVYIKVVISIFMMLFGINFNIFYYIIIGKFLQAVKDRELLVYFGIITASTLIIALNITPLYSSFSSAALDSYFQVTSIVTTTGFGGVCYDVWPAFSQAILILLMFCGSCAGSTCGGIKIVRVIIIVKAAMRELKRMVTPRSVSAVKLNDKPVEKEVVNGVGTFMLVYICVFAASFLAVCAFGADITTSFGAVTSCMNNVGPALGDIGSSGLYNTQALGTKIVLIFDMLAGRLELFPMLVLFSPSTWFKK